MKANLNLAKSIALCILTTGIASFMLAGCSSNDNPSSGQQGGQQTDNARPESYGLTYHNFDSPDDVQILNADTTEIAVRKSLADKLGITSFVNHPLGIWDDPSHLAFGRKAVEEQLIGDTYILKVTEVTAAELIGEKLAQLSTDIYVNKKVKSSGLTASGQPAEAGDYYTENDGTIHPAAVLMTDPYGYDTDYTVEGEQPAVRLHAAQKGQYEYKTPEDYLSNRLMATTSFSIISVKTKLEFDHDIPLGVGAKDSINISGEIPVNFALNYFLTIDPDIEWQWSGPKFTISKFETGLSGNFEFSPSAAIGFKKGVKLPEDMGKFKLAQFRGYTFTFMVGPVPVAIEVNPNFYLVINAEASGAVQLGFRYEYANHFKAGIRYQDKRWGLIKEFEVEKNDFSFLRPEVEFKAEAGVGLFLTATAKIYGVAGPELGVGPRLGAEAGLIASPDGLDWSAEVKLTLQAWAGAKVEILGYELAEWSTRFDLWGPLVILKLPEDD